MFIPAFAALEAARYSDENKSDHAYQAYEKTYYEVNVEDKHRSN